MISVVTNISTLEPRDRSTFLDPATSCDRDSEALRSFGSSSASANNPTTAINPVSPANALREQAVGGRSHCDQDKFGLAFVLGCSNIGLLQRIYGTAEAREGVVQALSGRSTQILFKPAA